MAGKSNHIAVGIGGSGLVGKTVAIFEAEAFRIGSIRSIVAQEDRICLSGMGRGHFGGKEIGRG
jgi:glucose-6-phosphate isomerase